MLWKARLWLSMVGVVSAMLWSSPALGQENLGVQPVTEYEQQLSLRVDPAVHTSAVVAELSYFDGAVLIDDWIGENHLVVIWNTVLAHVQAAWNDVPFELTLYYDAYGRPAFASDEVSGWVDVADGYLYGGLELRDGSEHMYAGLVPAGWDVLPPVFMAAATRKCICKGSLVIAQCAQIDACQIEILCRYMKKPGSPGEPLPPGGTPLPGYVVVTSDCKWRYVPTPRPKAVSSSSVGGG